VSRIVLAMLWEWWRMTRRQALFFGAIGLGAGWALIARSGVDPRGAFAVWILLLSLAPLAGLAVWSKNPLAGYPLPLAFARPVSTWLLVAVPMAYLGLVCAATYAVPATILRVALGAPFPILPVAMLLAAAMMLFGACNWFTRNKVARLAASFGLVMLMGPALRWLGPWSGPTGGPFPPPLAVDSVQLGVTGYVLLALAAAGAFVVTVRGVDRQRHGEGEPRLGGTTLAAPGGVAPKGFVEYFRDAADALVRIPCPTSSPLAAELWIETRARGVPVVAIGLVLAVLAPAVLGLAAHRDVGAISVVTFGVLAATVPFFAGVSVSFWNRASSLRAPMSAFEATRPMATARLVAVQVAVAVAALLVAYALIAAGIGLAAPLLYDDARFESLWRAVAGTWTAWSAAQATANVVFGLGVFVRMIALLATVRAFSALYGARLWAGVFAAALYMLVLAFAVVTDRVSGAIVGAHLWAVAVAIPVATGYVIVRALAERALRPAQVLAIAAAWLVLVVAALAVRDSFPGFDALAPAVAALVLSSSLLPLSVGVLTPWAYSRMRHA
jgi:hypothetical protein